MYLIDPDKCFKFGLKKVDGRYVPIQINDDTEIKEGQIIFEAKAFTTKDIIRFNSMNEVDQYDFIKNRTKCNCSMENMIPSILISVNYYVLGLSGMSEVDEKLFISIS